jgi:hypothetical protein
MSVQSYANQPGAIVAKRALDAQRYCGAISAIRRRRIVRAKIYRIFGIAQYRVDVYRPSRTQGGDFSVGQRWRSSE